MLNLFLFTCYAKRVNIATLLMEKVNTHVCLYPVIANENGWLGLEHKPYKRPRLG